MEHFPVRQGVLAVQSLEEAVRQPIVLTDAEQVCYEKIVRPVRRAEWLAWHAMLRQVLGAEVSADYDADGRPVLVGREGHIGVSHSRRYVALYCHPSARCGVDIEEVTRNFDRTACRFISPAERALAPAVEHFEALVWCAKEAVYKFAATEGLDLLRDIRIARIDVPASEIHVLLLEKPIALKYRVFDNHCLVYTA